VELHNGRYPARKDINTIGHLVAQLPPRYRFLLEFDLTGMTHHRGKRHNRMGGDEFIMVKKNIAPVAR
jgi:hypothetical protein